MNLGEGRIFRRAGVAEVADFLKSRNLLFYKLSPEKLSINNDGRTLFLQLFLNGKVKEYPMRKSFYLKLLRWFSFTENKFRQFGIDTITSILNDFLLSIKSDEVNIKIEDGEALTITSNKYTEVNDLEVIEMAGTLGIESIDRNDFFTRIYSEIKLKGYPIAGDEFGFGYNLFNSETGFHTLMMTHYILRYVCSNGAVVRVGKANESRVHYGYTENEMSDFLSRTIEESTKSFDHIMNALKISTEKTSENNITATKKKLNSILGKSDADDIIKALSPESTLYDLFNGITHYAKSQPINKQVNLQKLAGEILAEVGEWK